MNKELSEFFKSLTLYYKVEIEVKESIKNTCDIITITKDYKVAHLQVSKMARFIDPNYNKIIKSISLQAIYKLMQK